MRIALCNALYPTPDAPTIFGGAEVLVRQLAEGLAARGDEVIAIRTAPDGRRREETVNGVTVHFLPIRNLYPPFQERQNPLLRLAWHAIDDRGGPPRALKSVLEDFRPDIVNSHTLNGLSAGLWQTARALGAPVVHTLHDYYLTCPRCSRFKDGKSCGETCGSCALLTAVRQRRARRLDAVTSVSRRTLDIHLANGTFDPRTPMHVIRNVPNPAITPLEAVPFGGPLKIGYIGRFAQEKGVRLLVDAANRLPNGSVELILAGRVSDEERHRLEALATTVPLTFLGFVSPPDFYRRIHVTAAPSLWEEPAPLVIQDSLAAARPLVVTALGGAPESIEHEVTGWLVEPTADALEARLRALVARPEMIAAAHAALFSGAGKRRTFDDLVADYRAVYEKTIAGTGARDRSA